MNLAEARARDAADPLRHLRDRFLLPDGVIYLDGNSLGPLPRATVAANRDLIDRQWGERLIRSWSEGWMEAPQRIGSKIAPLIGADSDEVIVTDSTSVNLFKLIVAALQRDPARNVIVTELGNFPTDLHIAEGAVSCILGAELRAVPRDALADALDDRTALVLLTHVHYKSGHRFDLPDWTSRAHDSGALICWDLSHSTGAVALDLNAANADCAVGCGYKYLNGGPGAPAYIYVARRHQAALTNPISGWMGHAAPFAMEDGYRPGTGMERWRAGTPPMLAMNALEAGIDLFADIDLALLEAKSAALFDAFAAAGDALGLECVVPRDPSQRGSHIAFRHPHARAITDALIERGVIGDFREPDIIRFGLTPLYLGYADIVRAAEILEEVLAAHR
ncbi:kynureninase [Sphingomonas sp. LT1P40]|uniref:kynureninase n=1 Tax=Alteristakelama amylovorans TaxID=3096166 RepID=UPI002FC61B0D